VRAIARKGPGAPATGCFGVPTGQEEVQGAVALSVRRAEQLAGVGLGMGSVT
jgi:hypothetical protein